MIGWDENGEDRGAPVWAGAFRAMEWLAFALVCAGMIGGLVAYALTR